MKTQEQMRRDVCDINDEIDSAEFHPLQFIGRRIAMIFEGLCTKYGWTEEEIKHFYPDGTIEDAKKGGWVPNGSTSPRGADHAG